MTGADNVDTIYERQIINIIRGKCIDIASDM
jgi:hypothetical protein